MKSVEDKAGLAIDGGMLQGVLVRGADFRFGEWPCASSAAPAGEGADEEAAPKADPWSDAFHAARKELPIDVPVTLALPSDILVSKVLTLPEADDEAMDSMVRLQMEKIAPVSGDDLEVAYEKLGVADGRVRLFAVAMEMSRITEFGDALDKAGIAIYRIDSSLMCSWRSYCDANGAPEGCGAYVFVSPSGRYDLLVADGEGPVFARSLGKPGSAAELAREYMLSMLSLTGDVNAQSPASLTVVEPVDFTAALERDAVSAALADVAGFEPQWAYEDARFSAARGAVVRGGEEGLLDIIPGVWRDDARKSEARKRFIGGISVALLAWALASVALFMLPRMIKARTTSIEKQINAVSGEYRMVADTRTKVRLIRSYEDRTYSPVEMLLAVCDKLPEGVTLTSLNYDKGGELSGRTRTVGGVKVVGESENSPAVLKFKDDVDGLGLFSPGKLTGPTMDGKRQRYKFELDSRFGEEDAP